MPAKTTKTADAVKLNVRLPPTLHKRLVAQARRNKVSLNQEIVNQLEGHEATAAKEIAATAAEVAVKTVQEEALQEALDRIEKWAAERGMSIARLEDEPKASVVTQPMTNREINTVAALAAKIVLAEMAPAENATPEPDTGRPEEK